MKKNRIGKFFYPKGDTCPFLYYVINHIIIVDNYAD